MNLLLRKMNPMLPELVRDSAEGTPLNREYSSSDSLLSLEETRALLERYNLLIGQNIVEEGEFLR